MPLRSPLPFVNYSSRDWDSVREAFLDYLKKKFPNDWTDFSESNLGMALIEVVAYAFEVLSFSVDRAVNENFITTAQERQSVIKLAALLGYKLSSATAASVNLAILPEDIAKLTTPVFIAAGSKISAGDVIFEVDRDYTIINTTGTQWSVNGAEATEVPVFGAIQGQTISESFTGTGAKFQIYRTSKKPYIDKSSFVTVGGVTWLEVTSLVLGDPDDPLNQNIYEVILDKDDRLSVKFGDGVTGNIPSVGSAIVIYQRIGGGERGNVASGFSGSIPCTSAGTAATVKVYSTIPASGGTDRETVEHAKLYAPLWGRTTDRAITYDDYLALCSGYSDGQNGRVAKAGVIAQPTDGLSNTVTIYIWTEDGDGNLAEAAQPLKDSLRNFLNSRKVLTVYISPIQDGDNMPVDMNILLSVYPGFNQADIKRQAEIVLKSLFASSNVRYDNELRLSWVHDYLLAVPGVKSINIRSPQPETLTGTTIAIEDGTLPSQVGATATQVIITAPATRAANYYVNYNIILGTSATDVRVVRASTAVTGSGPVTLTLDEAPVSTPVATAPYSFTHPRRVRLSGITVAAEDDVKNRRLVLIKPPGGADDVERSIVSFDIVTNVAFVDKDFKSNPVSLTSTPVKAVITPDFFVSQTRAITLGSVQFEIEDAF